SREGDGPLRARGGVARQAPAHTTTGLGRSESLRRGGRRGRMRQTPSRGPQGQRKVVSSWKLTVSVRLWRVGLAVCSIVRETGRVPRRRVTPAPPAAPWRPGGPPCQSLR